MLLGADGGKNDADLTDARYFYGEAQYAGLFRTKDGGATWKDYADGLPSTMVYCLCEAPDGSGTVFVGTETGVYRRDKGSGTQWEEITGVDAPVTTYWTCEALQHENTIRYATYGRGIWDIQLDPEGLGCFPSVDEDGDGFDCDLDCDDSDDSVYPGAREVACDGVDANCDPNDELTVEACNALPAGCGCAAGGSVPGLAWLLCVPAIGLTMRRQRLDGSARTV
jgi:hypothetical protein